MSEVPANLVQKSPISRSSKLVVLIFGIFFVLGAVSILLFLNFNLPCRGPYGKPLYTGVVRGEEFEVGNDNFSALKVNACILSSQRINENEYVYTLGFFRNYWSMVKYHVRIGGKEPEVAVCNIIVEGKCQVLGVKEVVPLMPPKHIYSFYLVMKDRKSQLLNFNPQYESFMLRFKKALLTNKDYPPAEQVIQVSQIMF